MALKKLKYSWTGTCSLMVHNGNLANPFNPFAKKMKEIAKKRKKTDDDLMKLAELEFLGSLYMGEKGPVIPGHCIDAVMLKAAKRSKEGPMVKAGLWCEENPPLKYKGPKDPEALYKDGRFTDQRMVRVQQNKVLRTRPRFDEWGLDVTITYDTEVIPDEATVDQWMATAGSYVGLCEWAPRLGRFEAVRK
jgi:hypothetical protein